MCSRVLYYTCQLGHLVCVVRSFNYSRETVWSINHNEFQKGSIRINLLPYQKKNWFVNRQRDNSIIDKNTYTSELSRSFILRGNAGSIDKFRTFIEDSEFELAHAKSAHPKILYKSKYSSYVTLETQFLIICLKYLRSNLLSENPYNHW